MNVLLAVLSIIWISILAFIALVSILVSIAWVSLKAVIKMIIDTWKG